MATFTNERRAREKDEFLELGARRHWKMDYSQESTYGVTAYRKFQYRCGTTARVGVNRPEDRKRCWEAGLYLQFAAGAECSRSDVRLDPVRGWALDMEQLLEAPLELERAEGPSGVNLAWRMIMRRNGWPIVAAIFDIDMYAPIDVIKATLIKYQVPEGVATGA